MKNKRNCRICGKENPPTRYFNCLSCQPMLESEDADVYPESYDYGLNSEIKSEMVIVPSPFKFNSAVPRKKVQLAK